MGLASLNVDTSTPWGDNTVMELLGIGLMVWILASHYPGSHLIVGTDSQTAQMVTNKLGSRQRVLDAIVQWIRRILLKFNCTVWCYYVRDHPDNKPAESQL